MKKAPFFVIGSILSNGPCYYYTDGPVNSVKIDKDISPNTYLRNLKKFCRVGILFM